MIACKEIIQVAPMWHGLGRSQYYCSTHMMQDKINRLHNGVCEINRQRPLWTRFFYKYVHLIFVIFIHVPKLYRHNMELMQPYSLHKCTLATECSLSTMHEPLTLTLNV